MKATTFQSLFCAALVSLSTIQIASAQMGDQKPFQVNQGQNWIKSDPDANPDTKPNRKNKKAKVSKKPVEPINSVGPDGQPLTPDNTLVQETVTSEGIEREFYIHVPRNYDRSRPMPLVLCFHGGFSMGTRMDALTGLDAISDANGFLLVYPQAINRHWNDGRNIYGHDRYNDVQFVSDMLSHLERRWNIDTSRVYVTGISNGGFFSQYVTLMLPGQIAACASVAAGLPTIISSTRRVTKPVSMMYILGMSDPLSPFRGGAMHYKTFHDQGTVLSAADSTQFWVKANHCAAQPRTVDLPDLDPNDGTRVKYAQFPGGNKNTEVIVYGIEGGGHTWPGGNQALPVGTVGKTSRDLNASQVIWDFFKIHTANR